jgi:hypothetical protein
VNNFVKIMKAFSVIYAVVGLFFIFFHRFLLETLMTDPAPNRFWVVLTLSMMFMLSFVSWKASENPGERGYTQVHLLSKITSTTTFFLCYVFETHALGYLAGVFTDGIIAVIVYLLLRKLDAAPQQAAVRL